MYVDDNEKILNESLDPLSLTLKLFKVKTDLQNNKNDFDQHNNLKSSGFENLHMITSKIKIDEDYITIQGINFCKFIQRIKEYYSENNFSKIFMMIYTNKSEKLWKKGKINKRDMEIKYLKFPVFFALEISMIFDDLGDYYNVPYYRKISKMIKTKTWVSELHKPIEDIDIDTKNLKNIRYTLKPYQLEFIQMYPTLKNRFNLNGYILSFDQGLGKTLTATALAECLNCEQVVIVCPNSLKENWAYEIKEYFNIYGNEKIWKDEVYVQGSKKYNMTKKTKYIIVNLESIPSIYNLIDKNKKSMLIVDEMHNVRNIKGKRTQELIELKNRLADTDVLLMSGTPIKATPNEIIPSLMLIDPLFTEEVANLYNKCFNVNGIGTKEIVNTRFGIVMHRKTKKEVLTLPKKNIQTISFKLPDSNKYLSSVVKRDVRQVFEVYYNEELKHSEELRLRYINMVRKYSKAPVQELEEYLGYVNYEEKEYSEVELERIYKFIDIYVLPNILYPPDVKAFKEAQTAYLRMQERAMGKAMGQVLHPRRKEMFIQLYEKNKDEIINMISNSTKKTVIFSTLLDVVNHIHNDLNKQGVGCVKIVGGASDRMELIQEFKHNEDIEVLIATSQTLSTGVTLIEANQMFFFGTPWRSADYNQCCDRIYRIGQNTDVNIYNILLDTGTQLNLSTRMNNILNWSDNMFNNMIEGHDSDEKL